MSVQGLATIIFNVIQRQRALHPERPVLIGVAGAQGSGKTTASKLLEAANRPRFAYFSLDDVYLTRADRERLAHERHPLFATRGPPGTHDLELADRTVRALAEAGPDTRTRLPRFDKARDDRAPQAEWPIFLGRPEAILVDGWCLGATPGERGAPINAMEATEDPESIWRDAINAELDSRYRRFFDQFDAIIYLQPPNWEIVRSWRAQQEVETLGRALTVEDEARLDRFLQHYERVTRSMMAGRHRADTVVHLDQSRGIVRVEGAPNPPTSPS